MFVRIVHTSVEQSRHDVLVTNQNLSFVVRVGLSGFFVRCFSDSADEASFGARLAGWSWAERTKLGFTE